MIQLVWRDRTPRPGGPPISTSITEAESTRLAELAAGKLVLEVGAAYGFSAITMALAGAQVVSIDPHQWIAGSFPAFSRNVNAYGVSHRVTPDIRSSFAALPDMAGQGRLFDLIFIDGDHAEQAVDHDVTWARKLLSPGGVLACHDWEEATCPGVRAALERVLGVPPELVDTLAVYQGLAA